MQRQCTNPTNDLGQKSLNESMPSQQFEALEIVGNDNHLVVTLCIRPSAVLPAFIDHVEKRGFQFTSQDVLDLAFDVCHCLAFRAAIAADHFLYTV